MQHAPHLCTHNLLHMQSHTHNTHTHIPRGKATHLEGVSQPGLHAGGNRLPVLPAAPTTTCNVLWAPPQSSTVVNSGKRRREGAILEIQSLQSYSGHEQLSPAGLTMNKTSQLDLSTLLAVSASPGWVVLVATVLASRGEDVLPPCWSRRRPGACTRPDVEHLANIARQG